MMTRAAAGALLPLTIGFLLSACAEPEQQQLAEVEGPQVEEGYFPGADGVRLFYRKVGAGSETAVYLHGGPFSMADGGYELDQLADERTLIAFDQRSGGKSDLVGDPDLLTVEHYLRDLEALRQHFGLEKMILIGQSWGAGLATLYSARHPERVERLLLLSPMPPARDPYMGERISATNAVIGEAEVARMNAIPAEMQNAPDSLVQSLCEERIHLMFRGYLTDLSALDRMKVSYCEGTPAALRHQEMASATASVSLGAWDFRPHLQEISVPILVVEGKDTHVPLEATRVWAESSPNARLLLMPNANHMTWLEGDLPAFFRAMNQYLAGEWPEDAEEMGIGAG